MGLCYGFLSYHTSPETSSQTMGLSPQAFSPTKRESMRITRGLPTMPQKKHVGKLNTYFFQFGLAKLNLQLIYWEEEGDIY